jgi:hypothetical protein
MWGARMPVEIIVDNWNPRGRGNTGLKHSVMDRYRVNYIRQALIEKSKAGAGWSMWRKIGLMKMMANIGILMSNNIILEKQPIN